MIFQITNIDDANEALRNPADCDGPIVFDISTEYEGDTDGLPTGVYECRECMEKVVTNVGRSVTRTSRCPRCGDQQMKSTVDLMVQGRKIIYRKSAGVRMGKMQSARQCRELVYHTFENKRHAALVFDLGSQVNPTNIPISVSTCGDCQKKIINTLGQKLSECPDCEGNMEDDLLVYMVTQGAKVLYRWEDSCGG